MGRIHFYIGMIFNFITLTIDKERGFSLTDWINSCGNNKAIFYIVNIVSKEEDFIKVGITCNSIATRFSTLPYNVSLLFADYDSPIKIYNKEVTTHKLLRGLSLSYKPLIPFSGDTECYSLDALEVLSDLFKINI